MSKHLLSLYLTGIFEVAIGSLLSGALQFLFFYIGAVTLIMGFSTQIGFHGVLGKDSNGQHPLWSMLVFFNWHCLYRIIATYRLHPGDPRCVEIMPGWFVGAWPRPQDSLEPCAIVDLAAELPLKIKPSAYYSCPTLDRGAPSAEALEAVVQFAEGLHATSTKTIVHCAQGYGRSVMALSAILVRCHSFANWRTALEEIQKKRPHARLSQPQIQALERWSQEYNRSESKEH